MNAEKPKPVSFESSRFAPARRILTEAIAAHAFPGCAFGVLVAGQDAPPLSYVDALGTFTYEADSPAVTAATVYDLASVTKVVATTAAAMLLKQSGQLNLDTLLGDLLPEFLSSRSAADGAHKVKLRHLLAHNSGLPGYVEFFARNLIVRSSSSLPAASA